jgi:hypothetical protein
VIIATRNGYVYHKGVLLGRLVFTPASCLWKFYYHGRVAASYIAKSRDAVLDAVCAPLGISPPTNKR